MTREDRLRYDSWAWLVLEGGRGHWRGVRLEGGIEVPLSCTVFEYSSWQEYLSVKYMYSWRCRGLVLLPQYLTLQSVPTYLTYVGT